MFGGTTVIILLGIFLAVVASLIPVGNERSTVRRLPWVTFAIIGITVVVHYTTLPSRVIQERQLKASRGALQEFIDNHQELLGDENLRDELYQAGVVSRNRIREVESAVAKNPNFDKEYKAWTRGREAQKLKTQIDGLLTEFREVTGSHIWYQYGIAPGGRWQVYQMVTYAFVHAGVLHLSFNAIFFFAVAFSLEDLWGRTAFGVFFLLSSIVAALPVIIDPGQVPVIGASGAVSATMGAFLVRLPKTKVRLFVLLSSARMIVGKKASYMMAPGYIFIIAYFAAQLVQWLLESLTGEHSSTEFSVHIAGFGFGLVFALLFKASKTEERYINPKIEAKVTFGSALAVTEALNLLDRGDVAAAERTLKPHLAQNPDDVTAMLVLIQVCEKQCDYTQLNVLYGRLIHHHLARGDKEAALYAYDALLTSLPDNKVDVRIPARDWLVLCEYLRESGMHREAAVEYERLVNTHPNDPWTVHACVEGGEAALALNDIERALRLFEQGRGLYPPPTLVSRINIGIEKCKNRLAPPPAWMNQRHTNPLNDV